MASQEVSGRWSSRSAGRVERERFIGVGDGDEPDLREIEVEQLAGGAVAGCVGAADHAGADDGDADASSRSQLIQG